MLRGVIAFSRDWTPGIYEYKLAEGATNYNSTRPVGQKTRSEKLVRVTTRWKDLSSRAVASYVIKDRAIPDVDDGLKPVQRRILWTLYQMDNGTAARHYSVEDLSSLHRMFIAVLKSQKVTSAS